MIFIRIFPYLLFCVCVCVRAHVCGTKGEKRKAGKDFISKGFFFFFFKVNSQ